MTDIMRYYAVNWTDGMKISRKHFEASGNYFDEQLRGNAALLTDDFNFGILPGDTGLKLSIFCDVNQQISVSLECCDAVTSNGTRIQVAPEAGLSCQVNLKTLSDRYGLNMMNDQSFCILLGIDLFTRVPIGKPLPEENPPRHPYTKPKLILEVLPAQAVNRQSLDNVLIIGKISLLNGMLQEDKSFIPAVSAMHSLAVTTSWYTRFRQLFEEWEQYGFAIIQKVSGKMPGQQALTLATTVGNLCSRMMEQLARQKTRLNWMLASAPPVWLCTSIMENFQFLHTVLSCYSEKDREEALNYFAEWTDAASGTIVNQTRLLFGISYDHYELGTIFVELERCLAAWVRIFQRLSQLDFIGKHKGQSVFVIEQEIKDIKGMSSDNNQKPNNRWSPLT